MTARPRRGYELAVVGAGILGLATALAAARRGLRVTVIDRDLAALGASVRNFGFVTLSGQPRGAMWARARRTREVWREVADAAGIPIVQRGAWFAARRAESRAVFEAFLATEMAEGCRLLSPAEARSRCPQLPLPGLETVLESTLELRVESRDAIPRLAAWLAEAHGVEFRHGTSVTAVDPPQVTTSRGVIEAARVAVCPGDDFHSLFAKRLAALPLTRCKLQMLRLASPGFAFPAALLSDLSIGRYAGFANANAEAPLQARLSVEQGEHLENGVHLIVAQSADGTLVVGDSHHYAPAPDAIGHASVDELILDEYRAATGLEPPAVIARWVGTYASAADRPVLIDAPRPEVRLAIVTSGAGASTGFAIGEEVVESLFDRS